MQARRGQGDRRGALLGGPGGSSRGARAAGHGSRAGARGARGAQPAGQQVRDGEGPQRQPVLGDTQPEDTRRDDGQARGVQPSGPSARPSYVAHGAQAVCMFDRGVSRVCLLSTILDFFFVEPRDEARERPSQLGFLTAMLVCRQEACSGLSKNKQTG